MGKKRWFFAAVMVCLWCKVLCCQAASMGQTVFAEQKGVVYSVKNLSGDGETWVVDRKGKRYRTLKGKYLKNKWVKKTGQIYRLDADGYCKTGWYTYRGKKFYFQKNGRMVRNTWIRFSRKKRCYFDSNGVMARKCWVGKYYVDSNGWQLKDSIVDGCWLNAAGKKTIKIKKWKGDYIFVGDSRFVEMSVTDASLDTLYLAKRGSGYVWLTTTAEQMLKECLDVRPDVTVIFEHGVNDFVNINWYIEYYRKLITQYPQTAFYFMAVTPVDQELLKIYCRNSYARGLNNSVIREFNAKLEEAFPEKYIDTYSFLMETGFETADGLHYLDTTYDNLRNYIIEHVKRHMKLERPRYGMKR